MRLGFCLFLIVAIFSGVIYCQGGGGGGSRGGSRSRFSRSHYYSGGRNCTGDECQEKIGTIGYIVIGGMILFFCKTFYNIWSNDVSPPTNADYIKGSATEIKLKDSDQFLSGVWTSRYYQYGRWHGPYMFSLAFDSVTNTITGDGCDDVGQFAIEGIFSAQTNRMALIKTYRKGTGDRQQNLGHSVTIQVAWNVTENQFEGRWFVKTRKYQGNDKFELRLDRSYKAFE